MTITTSTPPATVQFDADMGQRLGTLAYQHLLTWTREQHIAKALEYFGECSVGQVVAEVISYNDAEVPDEVAQLVGELLAANGLGSEEPASYAALRALLEPVAGETPEAHAERHLRAAAVAIGLGLHVEEKGWLLRTLVEDPEDVTYPDWADLLEEIDRRLQVEVAEATTATEVACD